MLDEQELLATRVLNKTAKWDDIQAFIDKNYVKRSELEKRDKIIKEIAKSNIKIKGYEILDEYVENTIRFFTKKVENDESVFDKLKVDQKITVL